MADLYPQIPLDFQEYSADEMMSRSQEFLAMLKKRRTVREYSSRPIPKELLKNLILSGSSAPSGANKQPWTFVVVTDPEVKKKIREAAEKEEYENYHGRMSASWLRDLAPLGTDEHKPFLEIAPALVVIFKRAYEIEAGEKQKNYYVNESVGLAAGFFLAAAHQAGLVTLTHTPSPMNFLTKILNRPENERPFLLIPIGYPAEGATVPEITKKTVEEVAVWV